jgi:hypothetical protein
MRKFKADNGQVICVGKDKIGERPYVLNGKGEFARYLEEIKTEEFWFLQYNGQVMQGFDTMKDWGVVPNWLRFPTKEHAQAFADFMKTSMSGVNWIGFTASTIDGTIELTNLCNAINSRRSHD